MLIRHFTRTVITLTLVGLAAVPVRAAASSAVPTYGLLRLLGDNHGAAGAHVTLGGSGNIFLAGTTYSTTWPTPWSHSCDFAPTGSCAHTFVAKMSRDGSHTFYTVRIGGSREDRVSGIAVDRGGNAYITGITTSRDFPTLNAIQRHCADPAGTCNDAFVTKIDPRGRVVYSTYLGGKKQDGATGIAVDRWGAAYVTGYTMSGNFPITHALQNGLRGHANAFVSKLSPSGRNLIYSTYLGGSGYDSATGVAVDSYGQAYVAGNTGSSNLRVSPRAVQRRLAGGRCFSYGCNDAFVMKIGTHGRFLAGTYFGTIGDDTAGGVALDGKNNVYLAGTTGAPTIPSTRGVFNGPDKAFCGQEGDISPCAAAFVAELTSNLDRVLYSTVLSGNGADRANALSVDAGGTAIVGGSTQSSDFPTMHPLQAATGGGDCTVNRGGEASCDGFLAVIAPRGHSVLFSTYVGGDGQDTVQSVAIDGHGRVTFSGESDSTHIPSCADAGTRNVTRLLFGQVAVY